MLPKFRPVFRGRFPPVGQQLPVHVYHFLGYVFLSVYADALQQLDELIPRGWRGLSAKVAPHGCGFRCRLLSYSRVVSPRFSDSMKGFRVVDTTEKKHPTASVMCSAVNSACRTAFSVLVVQIECIYP